jgi:cytochrome c oxidase cbb3-type subunit 3
MKRNNLICVKLILWYIKFAERGHTYESCDVTWRIVPKVRLVLSLFAAIGSALCQNSNGKESAPSSRPDLKGKGIFEMRCALCHGLDGLGGEHAPDVVRQSAVRTLSDEALLNVIHEGIPQRGMPGFSDIGKEDADAVIAYLRFLQGKSAVDSMPGDPVRGQDLFFGRKAGCSACHVMRGRGQFIAEDLTGFAQDHEAGEIRDAILKPSEGQRKAATAIARDGRQFSGMIRNEDNRSLQLQDEDGRFYLLMKSTLVSVRRRIGTPMPVDYGQRLSATELDDLVAYIVRDAGTPYLPASPSAKDDKEAHAED